MADDEGDSTALDDDDGYDPTVTCLDATVKAELQVMTMNDRWAMGEQATTMTMTGVMIVVVVALPDW